MSMSHQGGELGGGGPPTGFLRLKQVLELYPVSPATWWRGVRSGRFPRAYKLGPNSTGWLAADIQALLERTKQEAA